jgi:lipopolysaccharide export system permease protein
MNKMIFKKILYDCFKFFSLSILSIATIIWVLQAVNFLDFVVEDGHGFLVYLNYTLLSFPKTLSRIFPFAVFFSFSYILLKYESNNELVIFWNFGVNKIKFINIFINFSLIYMVVHLILNAFLVPLSQDKARSFLRTSDLNFFESILKPKKFIDVVNNLTIFFDEKKESGELKNIFLKDNSKENGFQITTSKTGKFEFRGDKKILVLYDGKTIKNQNKKTSEFEFSKTDFNIDKYNSKTNIVQKTQENSTVQLLKCLLILKKVKKDLGQRNNLKVDNCLIGNLDNIYAELYKRLVMPFYNILLVMTSLLLIVKSKSQHGFRLYKFQVFILGFLCIIFSEISLKFININTFNNIFISLLPIFLSMILYLYFINKFRFTK